MAVQKCKSAFVALALTCLIQTTASSPPLVGGEKYSAPRELEILGHAAFEIVKSFGDFLQSLMTIIRASFSKALDKVSLPLFIKWNVIVTASGVQIAQLPTTQEQYFECRVVACTLLQLRQKLNVTERFEEEYESIMAEASTELLALPAARRENTGWADLGRFFWNLTETADRRLKQHPELKEMYLQAREVVQAEERSVTPFIWDMEKYSSDIGRPLELSNAIYRLLKALPESVIKKISTAILNKVFLQHTVNRVTILQKNFVMARSTLELSKKRGKAEMVQQVYDKTLREVVNFLFVNRKSGYFAMIEELFKQLKSNFEANPPLNQEWREIQKYVSQSHDWDRSIWDLDLLPF